MSDKVKIRILGDSFEANKGDTLLQTLRLYAQARNLPDYGFKNFCWNASCHQCVLRYRCGDLEDRDFACQTEVDAELCIDSLPEVLRWTGHLNSRKDL